MKPGFESRSNLIWWISLLGICLVALSAFRSLPQISDLLLNADGDDQMRLVQVRDWLAGQGWYDTRQYRVLPPEGIPMHWSRYVDAGIAGVLSVVALILPADQAELMTVILWPCLLAVLMVLVLAHGSQRVMGTASALGALAVFLTWAKLGGEFVPPRIDHHNVQILCGTAIFYLSLVPGRKRLLGALAGGLTAVSLAVGLEMLPFLATLWSMVALRHAFGETPAGDWLLGFAGAFVIAGPLLMAGQTASADWWVDHCDAMAPPVLALGAIGVVATVTPVLASAVLVGPVPRLLVMVALAALGLWLAWPVLGHCISGPYAQVSPEVLRIIESNVVEGLPAKILIDTDPELLARVLLPPLVLAVLAALVAWQQRHQLNPVQVTALAQSFVLGAVGFTFATMQIRAANLMTPVVPLLGGFLVYAFTLVPKANQFRLLAAITLILAMPAVVERGAALALRMSASPGAGLATLEPYSDCRTPQAITEIASLPKSLVFSSLNLGPAILAYTPHSVTSAGYHRSSDAFWNGVGAFQSEGNLRTALKRSKADYLVLCAGGRLEQSSEIMQSLLKGPLPNWLTDVTESRREVRVFRVEHPALVGTLP